MAGDSPTERYGELFERCSGPYDRRSRIERWILERDAIAAAMEIALLETPPQPFRAAYSLEKIFLSDPRLFVPYHKRFVRDFCRMKNPSVWRHYGKIMALLLRRKEIGLSEKEKEIIAEAAFRFLLHPEAKVGMQVHMLDILHRLRGEVPMIGEYLPEVIHHLSLDPSPGMVSRLRRLGYIR